MADRSKLAAIAKSLNVDEGPRFDLLAEIMDEGDRVNDAEGAAAIVESMGVAARQFGLGHVEAKPILQKGMRMVARRHDARWGNVIWFNQDFRKLVETMDQAERAEVQHLVREPSESAPAAVPNDRLLIQSASTPTGARRQHSLQR